MGFKCVQLFHRITLIKQLISPLFHVPLVERNAVFTSLRLRILHTAPHVLHDLQSVISNITLNINLLSEINLIWSFLSTVRE